jgi:hypothetical protein
MKILLDENILTKVKYDLGKAYEIEDGQRYGMDWKEKR